MERQRFHGHRVRAPRCSSRGGESVQIKAAELTSPGSTRARRPLLPTFSTWTPTAIPVRAAGPPTACRSIRPAKPSPCLADVNQGNHQFCPIITPDGAGGVLIAWEDLRNGGAEQVFAQRVNSAGTALWAASGVLVADAPAAGHDESGGPVVASDGGMFVVYYDSAPLAQGGLNWRVQKAPTPPRAPNCSDRKRRRDRHVHDGPGLDRRLVSHPRQFRGLLFRRGRPALQRQHLQGFRVQHHHRRRRELGDHLELRGQRSGALHGHRAGQRGRLLCRLDGLARRGGEMDIYRNESPEQRHGLLRLVGRGQRRQPHRRLPLR